MWTFEPLGCVVLALGLIEPAGCSASAPPAARDGGGRTSPSEPPRSADADGAPRDPHDAGGGGVSRDLGSAELARLCPALRGRDAPAATRSVPTFRLGALGELTAIAPRILEPYRRALGDCVLSPIVEIDKLAMGQGWYSRRNTDLVEPDTLAYVDASGWVVLFRFERRSGEPSLAEIRLWTAHAAAPPRRSR